MTVPSGTRSGAYTAVIADGQNEFIASTGFSVSTALVSLKPNIVAAGQTASMTGQNLPANTQVTAMAPYQIRFTPSPSVATDHSGHLPATALVIPAGTEPGAYTITVTEADTGGAYVIATATLQVKA
jgi:hypothetical protein